MPYPYLLSQFFFLWDRKICQIVRSSIHFFPSFLEESSCSQLFPQVLLYSWIWSNQRPEMLLKNFFQQNLKNLFCFITSFENFIYIEIIIIFPLCNWFFYILNQIINFMIFLRNGCLNFRIYYLIFSFLILNMSISILTPFPFNSYFYD